MACVTLRLTPELSELGRHTRQVRCDSQWLGHPMHRQGSLAWSVHKPSRVAHILRSESVPGVCRDHAARGWGNIQFFRNHVIYRLSHLKAAYTVCIECRSKKSAMPARASWVSLPLEPGGEFVKVTRRNPACFSIRKPSGTSGYAGNDNSRVPNSSTSAGLISTWWILPTIRSTAWANSKNVPG